MGRCENCGDWLDEEEGEVCDICKEDEDYEEDEYD